MDETPAWDFKAFLGTPIAGAVLAVIALLTHRPLGAALDLAVFGVGYVIAASPATIRLRRRAARRRARKQIVGPRFETERDREL